MRWSPSGLMASARWSNPTGFWAPTSWPSESAWRLDVRTTSIYPLPKRSPDRALGGKNIRANKASSYAEVAREPRRRASWTQTQDPGSGGDVREYPRDHVNPNH